jgi:hypothetical protein
MWPKRVMSGVRADETGAATDMARRYGRCPRGQRLVSSVPWGHRKTTTFVAALRVGQIAAPCVFDGPMDGPSFRGYVEQFVVPILPRAGSAARRRPLMGMPPTLPRVPLPCTSARVASWSRPLPRPLTSPAS